MLKGIDVSSHQGTVDWDAWKRKGLAFAVAKATEGRTIHDSEFARNWAELRRAGLVCGAYHFGHPGNDANTEADFFLSTVRPRGLEAGDLLVLDLEQTDGRSAAHVSSWVRTWCSRRRRSAATPSSTHSCPSPRTGTAPGSAVIPCGSPPRHVRRAGHGRG
ncbi:glycoside hydrolase family 25 protein [Actinoallomurus purpureus]|uniref:glycoside hydrolase family 25 protein n=1 Tax=Actinoallomurus purpureus TaxID=478114 RepID=UPI003556245A